MPCVEDSELRAFVAGRLEGPALARVERALDGCTHCQGRLGALARLAEGRTDAPSDPASSLADALFEPGPDPWLGRLLGGRYRVVRRLGRGGMGAVYEAEHELIGRRVALKLLHAEMASRRDVLQRFRNEARAAGAIGHPGIVQALDVGRTEDGAPFLVLELLEGRDLEAELADRGALPVAEAVDLGVAVADAVSAAHALAIVHRDLKPANVFLGDDGAIKVLDFGISKVRGALQTSPDTASGAILGTPAYMAPEQLQDAAGADARSDVYALGAILYRALAGELPHRESSLPALLAAILARPPRPVRAHRPEVPEALDAAVRRALAIDPDDRFADMTAFRDALAALTSTGRRSTVRPVGEAHERRIVTALSVREPEDREAVAEAVRALGGKVLPGADGALLALFGDDSWSGDVVHRVLRLALELSKRARRVVVGPAVWARGVLEPSPETARAFDGVAPGAFVTADLVHAVADGLAVGPGGRLERSEDGPDRPLVGRAGELAQLAEAVELAREEQTCAVAWIEGAPGVGKTRLLDALAARLRRDHPDVRVLRAHLGPRDARSELAVLRSSLRDFAGLDERSPEPIARAAVEAAAVTACGPARGPRHAPFLATLLGVAGAAGRGDARFVHDRVRVAALEVLEGLARHRVTALLVDDAQWMDEASAALLGALIQRLGDAPLAIVVAGRTELAERAPEWLGDLDVVRVRPRALRRHEVRELSAPWLGDARAGTLAERLHRHTGGNPLFVEQLARALADGAHVDDALPLPPTVEGAVQARLDALEPDAREALKRAAVLGGAFRVEDLEALGVEAALPIARALADRGLLRRIPDGASAPRFAVATPLLADAAHRMLDDAARAELHRRAAERLEGGAPAEEVARHLERGGLNRRAAERFAEAALAAAERSDAPQVVEHGEHALALGLEPEARFAVRTALAGAFEVLGRLEDQARVLEEAEREARPGAARADVQTHRAVAMQRLGRSDEALPLLEAAVREAEGSDDATVLARALGGRVVALVYAGRIAEATRALRRAEALVWTRAGALRADAAVWRAQLAAATGDLGERRNAYWAAAELYRERGDLRREAGASSNLADVYNRVGAHDEAEPALRAALEACQRLGMQLIEGYAWVNLGYAQLGLGRVAEAAESLRRGDAIAARVGDPRLRMAARLYAARVALTEGRAERAHARAVELVEEADALGFGGLVALALALQARAALTAGRIDAAVEAAERALAARDALGGVEEGEGEVFLVLAESLEAAGRAEEGAAIRARGRATLEAAAARIGDAHWRGRFLADVPAHRALLEGDAA
ncbi:MAG TPA: protein kinase [Sandaracinaceae bacterium LLY-WYZ-13_1]|nr:protein kinase [Sandaracinaceae bacterium LLY-WYZ-13_1]